MEGLSIYLFGVFIITALQRKAYCDSKNKDECTFVFFPSFLANLFAWPVVLFSLIMIFVSSNPAVSDDL